MEQENQVYVKLQKHLEKLKLAGKLVVDSIRTGHMNLFK